MSDRTYGQAPKDLDERIAWAKAIAEKNRPQGGSTTNDSDDNGPDPTPSLGGIKQPEPER